MTYFDSGLLPTVPFLGKEEERQLIEQAQKGCARSRDKVVLSHLQLVRKAASKYAGYGRLDHHDLLSEGNIGLLKALDAFDLTQETRFATYAVWWVLAEIRMFARNQSRDVRFSGNVYVASARVKHAQKDLLQELGREPTEKELAEKAELTLEQLRSLRAVKRMTVFSLDKPVGEDTEETIGDRIVSNSYLGPESLAVARSELKRLRQLLQASLKAAHGAYARSPNAEERIELFTKYHTGGPKNHPTLEILAKHYSVSRARVWQILERGLERARICSGVGPKTNPIFDLRYRIELLEEIIRS